MNNLYSDGELEYSDLIADVGLRNKDRLPWYASSVSSKCPGPDSVWERIHGDAEPSEGINPFTLLRILAERVYRTRLLCPPFVRRHSRDNIERHNGKYTFLSWYCSRSWQMDGEVYNDICWGRLLKECEPDDALVTFSIVDDEAEFLDRVKSDKFRQCRTRVLPLEYYMRPIDCLKALWLTVFGRFDLPDKIIFAGRDIKTIIIRALRRDRWHGEIFRNLCMYFAFRRLARDGVSRRVFFPWENHSWSKLLVLAFAKENSQARLIGFQHASIPSIYLNHFPSKHEVDYTPFPHTLLTTGQLPYDMLQTFGAFPPDCLKVGCALRQDYIHDYGLKESAIHASPAIGIATPTDIDVAVTVIEAAITAFSDSDSKVSVRLYPIMRADTILAACGELPNNFEFNDGTLETFLETCDIVVYSETAVSLEALAIGNPVVYYDVGKGAGGDPAFANELLKWNASDPEALKRCIDEISALSASLLNRDRKVARIFVESYFHPVTSETIRGFLDA